MCVAGPRRWPETEPREVGPCDLGDRTPVVGGPVERGVVPDHEPVVPCPPDVGLDVAVSEPDRVLERLDGVLRPFGRPAPVRMGNGTIVVEPTHDVHRPPSASVPGVGGHRTPGRYRPPS